MSKFSCWWIVFLLVSQVSSDGLSASHECRVSYVVNDEQIQLLDGFSVGFTSFY